MRLQHSMRWAPRPVALATTWGHCPTGIVLCMPLGGAPWHSALATLRQHLIVRSTIACPLLS
eukprot:6075326-Pyramimonas_sp.AAC.1